MKGSWTTIFNNVQIALLKATLEKQVFKSGLKQFIVSGRLQFSGTLFQISGAEEPKAASPCLGLVLGVQSRFTVSLQCVLEIYFVIYRQVF